MDDEERKWEGAKLSLAQRVGLYQFFVTSYMQGIAFFLTITGVLLKFALERETNHRAVFVIAGLAFLLAACFPLLGARRYERDMAKRFQRLAAQTSTEPVDTTPLRNLIYATWVFWVIIAVGWAYVCWLWWTNELVSAERPLAL